MKLKYKSLTFFLFLSLSAKAQVSSEDYEDYESFSTDPIELDEEVKNIFGRFFQQSLYLGSSIMTGDLGAAYQSGFHGQVKFVLYLDKIWATELGVGLSKHKVAYNIKDADGDETDLSMDSQLIPVSLGIRYGFNPDVLGRGMSALNPYLSANAEFVFRKETVTGTATVATLPDNLQDKFGTGAKYSDTSFGFNFGGGLDFDVYRRTVYLGVDVRYHAIFWSDAATNFGTDDESGKSYDRSGNYITLLGSVTYNY